MALPNLASEADLAERGVTVDDVFVRVASTLVREAAGSPILQTTATVTVWATEPGPWLDLYVRPVTAVAVVHVEGEPATDYKLVDGTLWRRVGWFRGEPTEVTASVTIGLLVVPDSIVQLVIDLAILGSKTAADGALDPRVLTERVDDYSVTFNTQAAPVASAMTVPAATRHALRARFGGGVGSVRFR